MKGKLRERERTDAKGEGSTKSAMRRGAAAQSAAAAEEESWCSSGGASMSLASSRVRVMVAWLGSS